MNRPPPSPKPDDDRVRMEQCFTENRGTLIGSSAVVSRKVHLEPREQPGLIHILVEKDAGRTYLSQEEYDKFVHIDVFHQSAEINIADLAGRLRNAIHRFLKQYDIQQPAPEERELAAINLARHIHLVTGAGEGTVLEPHRQVYPPPARRNSHVHILAQLPPRQYSFIYNIIGETEKTLRYHGVKLRPVRQIIHIHAKKI